MVMPVMQGGGAERVAALLMNEFHRNGYQVEFLLTSATEEETVRVDLNDEIPIQYLKRTDYSVKRVRRWCASACCRLFEMFHIEVPAIFAKWSFQCQYREEIQQLREKLTTNPEMDVITFLQPSIPMVVLAAQNLPNRIIISERGNPERLMKKRYGKRFIEKYYRSIDVAVFQTEDAKSKYPVNVQEKGVVISNPLKEGLPQQYTGERNKKISTFCRISKQKNLPLLVHAFALLHKDYPEYCLRIIGDTLNEEGILVQKELEKDIQRMGIQECVEFLPFSKHVHEEILEDCMYVNSSDYEGMSNAMLEAMAIGLPVVCTDCPIGGARAIIEDGKNGLLVPVGDVDKLYQAMRRIAEDKELADRLSSNAVLIREELSLENIAKKWMELV
jgi:glycosyltransferase involved in cell wall biosynthesis